MNSDSLFLYKYFNTFSLNVALTRARYAEYIVGNFRILKRNHTWKELMDDAIRRKKFVNVQQRPSKGQFANYLQSVVGD